MFVQLYNQIHFIDSNKLKQKKRAWKTVFLQEGATDIGGPYSDTFTQCIADIYKKESDLFIPCSNMSSSTGLNQDKYIPTGRLTKKKLSQLKFLGIVCLKCKLYILFFYYFFSSKV